MFNGRRSLNFCPLCSGRGVGRPSRERDGEEGERDEGGHHRPGLVDRSDEGRLLGQGCEEGERRGVERPGLRRDELGRQPDRGGGGGVAGLEPLDQRRGVDRRAAVEHDIDEREPDRAAEVAHEIE